MTTLVKLARLPPVADDQAVEQALKVLELGLRRGLLRRVEEQCQSSEAQGS